MSATHRLPIRSIPLQISFALYAILILGSMATMSIGAALLAFSVFISYGSLSEIKKQIQFEWKSRSVRVYLILSFCLTLACGISLLSAQFFPLTFNGKTSEVHFFQDSAKLWYLYWPLILLLGFRRLSSAQLSHIFHVWLGMFGLLSLFGIIQFFIGWPKYQYIPNVFLNSSPVYHATLFFGHHLSSASILIFPFFAVVAILLHRSKNKSNRFGLEDESLLKSDKRNHWMTSPKATFITALIAFFGLITLFLTYSRTEWISVPLGILLIITCSVPKRWAALIVFVTLTLAFGLSATPLIQSRIHDSIGINTRLELWKANLEFFNLRPFFGVGLRHNHELAGLYLIEKLKVADVFSGHAHNNLLDMLSGIGFVGTLIWISWSAWVIRICMGLPLVSRLNIVKFGFIFAWIVFHLNGLTQVNFWEAKVQHQMAWVIAWSLI